MMKNETFTHMFDKINPGEKTRERMLGNAFAKARAAEKPRIMRNVVAVGAICAVIGIAAVVSIPLINSGFGVENAEDFNYSYGVTLPAGKYIHNSGDRSKYIEVYEDSTLQVFGLDYVRDIMRISGDEDDRYIQAGFGDIDDAEVERRAERFFQRRSFEVMHWFPNGVYDNPPDDVTIYLAEEELEKYKSCSVITFFDDEWNATGGCVYYDESYLLFRGHTFVYAGDVDFDTFSNDSDIRDLQKQQLENWLTAMFNTIPKVKYSSVKLNVPDPLGYELAEDEPKVHVSVALKFKEGETLTQAQIDGIYKMLTDAVPHLEANSISVSGDNGISLVMSGYLTDDE